MFKSKAGGFALLLFMSVHGFSQNKSDSIVYYLRPIISEIEVLIGPSSVFIHGNEKFDSNGELKVGYAGGLGFIHNFGRRVALNARILWERKGFRQSQEISYTPISGSSPVTGTIKSNTNNDYLTVSVMPRLAFGRFRRFYIGAGVYYGSLRKSKTTDHYFYPTPYNATINSKNGFDRYDGGLSFSLGYTFPFRKKVSFTIQLLDNYGLRQISKFYNLNPGYLPIRNNSYSVLFGVNF